MNREEFKKHIRVSQMPQPEEANRGTTHKAIEASFGRTFAVHFDGDYETQLRRQIDLLYDSIFALRNEPVINALVEARRYVHVALNYRDNERLMRLLDNIGAALSLPPRNEDLQG